MRDCRSVTTWFYVRVQRRRLPICRARLDCSSLYSGPLNGTRQPSSNPKPWTEVRHNRKYNSSPPQTLTAAKPFDERREKVFCFVFKYRRLTDIGYRKLSCSSWWGNRL